MITIDPIRKRTREKEKSDIYKFLEQSLVPSYDSNRDLQWTRRTVKKGELHRGVSSMFNPSHDRVRNTLGSDTSSLRTDSSGDEWMNENEKSRSPVAVDKLDDPITIDFDQLNKYMPPKSPQNFGIQ